MGRKRYPMWSSIHLLSFPNSPNVKEFSGRIITHLNNLPIWKSPKKLKNLPRTFSLLVWTGNFSFSWNDTRDREPTRTTLKAAGTQTGEALTLDAWGQSHSTATRDGMSTREESSAGWYLFSATHSLAAIKDPQKSKVPPVRKDHFANKTS